MISITQKDKRTTKYFEIKDNGILVSNKSPLEKNEYFVSFHDIGNDFSIKRKKNDSFVILLMISFFLNAIFINVFIVEEYKLSIQLGMITFFLLLIPCIVLTTIFNNHWKIQDSKVLVANKPIVFFYRKEDVIEVDKFLNILHESQKKYFLNLYYKVDKILPYDVQKNRIIWLYENKYTSQSDTEFILKQLEAMRIIGTI